MKPPERESELGKAGKVQLVELSRRRVLNVVTHSTADFEPRLRGWPTEFQESDVGTNCAKLEPRVIGCDPPRRHESEIMGTFARL